MYLRHVTYSIRMLDGRLRVNLVAKSVNRDQIPAILIFNDNGWLRHLFEQIHTQRERERGGGQGRV